MKTSIGAAVLTVALAVGDPLGTASAAAAPAKPAMQTSDSRRAIDFSTRRYHRRYHHHGYPTYHRPQPHYYARPYYYRPYPYSVPAPFTFGFGFGPRWW